MTDKSGNKQTNNQTNNPLLTLVSFRAGSSKPRPLFRWTEGDSVAREANRTDFRASAHGGESLRSLIEFRARPADDGRTFSCSAHNPTVREPHLLTARVVLVVLCEFLFVRSCQMGHFVGNYATCYIGFLWTSTKFVNKNILIVAHIF